MTEVTQPQSNEPIAGLTTEAVKRIKGEELDPNGIVELFQEPAYAGIPPLDVWAQVGNLDLALLTIDNIQLIRNIGNQILKESQSDTSLDSNALDALTIIAERVSKIGDFVLESTFQPIDVIGMCKDIDLETPDTILDEFRKLPNIIQEEELYIWATASKIPLSSISFPNLIFLIQIGARINGLENPEQAIKKPELDGLVVLTGELNERITSLTIEQTETPNANLTPNEIATLLDEVKTTISGKKLHPNQVVKLFKKKER